MIETATSVTVTRDCPATAVPAGTPITLPAGSTVQVVQKLGAAITVRTPHGLARVAASDADALGEPTRPDAGRHVFVRRTEFSMDQVTEALRTVYDPEIPIDIVELGLVYRCDEVIDTEGRRLIDIDMSMTAPGCGMGDVLRADVERVVGQVPGVDGVVATLVWEPPWSFARLSDTARLQLGLI
jgi:probable FeS assembly SUF system protein SufT